MEMAHRYTAEEVDWLKENAAGTSFRELTTQFNETFGTELKYTAVKTACKNRGIKNGLWKVYTDEHIEWIRDNIALVPLNDFLTLFNKHFGLDLRYSQLHALIYSNGFGNGRNTELVKGERRSPATEFKKGHVTWNKGKKGISYPGCIPTQFKKGHTPKNHRPVGSERICVDGYTWVKVKEPRTWREKHHIIWEEANGPIPKGHCVIFADGDRTNIVLENLLLITRRHLSIMNHRKLISNNAELTKTGAAIADVIMKINDRLTPKQRRQRYNAAAREKAKEYEKGEK